MGMCQARSTVHPRAHNRRFSIVSNDSVNSIANPNPLTKVDSLTQTFNNILQDINDNKIKVYEFRTRLTENQIQLKQLLQPHLLEHELIILLKDNLTTVLKKWNSSVLNETDKLIFRNIAIFLSELIEQCNNHTQPKIYQALLFYLPFIEVTQECLIDMASNGKHLTNVDDECNLESFTYLLDIFCKLETYSNFHSDEIESILNLLTAISDIIRSKYYLDTFLQLSHKASNFSILQRFILDKCPFLLNAYKGEHSYEIHDTLLEQIFDQYVEILEHFLPYTEEWTTPVMSAITHIIDIMINASLTAQTHIFQQPNIIDYGLTILRSSHLCAQLQLQHMTPDTWLINSIFTGMHNMIYDVKLLAILKRKAITSAFIKITNIAYYDRIQIHAYLILAGILSEAEIKELNNAKEITMVFLKYLSKAIISPDRKFKGVTMFSILCGLKALVQHDDIKDAILDQDQSLQLFETIILKSTDYELGHALSILWTLSFNKKVASVILQKAKLMERIQLLTEKAKNDANDVKSSDDSPKTSLREHIKINNMISSAAEGILWQVQNEDKSDEHVIDHAPLHVTKTAVVSTKKYDVMISYSHDDRQLCHKIADSLISDGFSVWIDKNNMTGSTPVAIADGIENSDVVLMGMTYSYKVSPWCQREGNYAFQRQTKVIPLKLPPAYVPDGWLGLLVANLTYINFCKLDFDVAYAQLKGEIRKYQKQEVPSNESHRKSFTGDTEGEKSVNAYAIVLVQDWTKEHVIDFLNDKKLHSFILLCTDMDGSALYQLYKFCEENSTLAFVSLQQQLKNKNADSDLSLIEYSRFIGEMKKIM